MYAGFPECSLVDKKLSRAKNAVKIEQILMKEVPKVSWEFFRIYWFSRKTNLRGKTPEMRYMSVK